MLDATSTNNSVTQTGLNVDGDNAARDINKPTYNFISSTGKGHPATALLARLTEQYQADRKNNVTFNETIERLQHYGTQVSSGPALTLEEKLTKGGREDLIDFALRMKEQYAKKLTKHSLFESAQEMHGFLLAEVVTRYYELVYPHVCKGTDIQAVNLAVRTQIIDPLLGTLGENVLGLYADDINGMLYFLTGKCHIKWAK